MLNAQWSPQQISARLTVDYRTLLGKRYLYFCSACHKTLGVTHRKGFFMG